MWSAGNDFIDRTLQRLTVTNQGVHPACHARLGRHPRRQETLSGLYIQLSQQQQRVGIRRRFGEMRAQHSLSVLRCLLAKRSIPNSDPWLLRIQRIATSRIYHLGKRIPRRLQHYGSALRKLIRSLAAAGVSSGDANGEKLFPLRKPQSALAIQRCWERLLMGFAA